jgi:putative ABC transport system substrate-binding protein
MILQEPEIGEGGDLLIEYRFAEGEAGRFPGLAAELVRLPVDVIVTWGTPATLAALNATSSIPIIMSAGDPVGAGLVTSVAQPGRNLTGLSSQTAGREEKRLELPKELLPNLSRVAVLSNSTNPYCVIALQHAGRGAAALGLALDVADVSAVSELDTAFRATSQRRPDAALVRRSVSGARARACHQAYGVLPTSVHLCLPRTCRGGGLMAFMTDYYDIFRREAAFIDKIFKGAKPGDLPVEKPTKFELVINLKTAKTLALEVPTTLLARADEVIE